MREPGSYPSSQRPRYTLIAASEEISDRSTRYPLVTDFSVPISEDAARLKFSEGDVKPVIADGIDPLQICGEEADRLKDWMREDAFLYDRIVETRRGDTGTRFTLQKDYEDALLQLTIDFEHRVSSYSSFPGHGTVTRKTLYHLPDELCNRFEKGVAAAQLSLATQFNPARFNEFLREQPVEKTAPALSLLYDYNPGIEQHVAEELPGLYNDTRREQLSVETSNTSLPETADLLYTLVTDLSLSSDQNGGER